MIGVRPINDIKSARKGTINNVNSRCMKQVSVFTAVLLSHNIPVSERASCAALEPRCSTVASAERQRWNKRDVRAEETSEAERALRRRAEKRNFQCWWRSRGGGVRANDPAYRVEFGPRTTTGDDWGVLYSLCFFELFKEPSPTGSLWTMGNSSEM